MNSMTVPSPKKTSPAKPPKVHHRLELGHLPGLLQAVANDKQNAGLIGYFVGTFHS